MGYVWFYSLCIISSFWSWYTGETQCWMCEKETQRTDRAKLLWHAAKDPLCWQSWLRGEGRFWKRDKQCQSPAERQCINPFPLRGDSRLSCRNHFQEKKQCGSLSQIWLSATLQTEACQASPWNSPGKNTGVGCCALLAGVFPTQG